MQTLPAESSGPQIFNYGRPNPAIACRIHNRVAKPTDAVVTAAAKTAARINIHPTPSLNDSTEGAFWLTDVVSNFTSACCTSRRPIATHQGKLTARRLVITFVPTTGRKLEESPQVERAVDRAARNAATPSWQPPWN